MPVFAYRARNPQGEMVSGTLDTPDEASVAAHLDRLGYSIIDIRSQGVLLPAARAFERFQGLKKQEIIIFTRQLATLIRSGMPLLPALGTISEQTANKKFRVILDDVRQAVQGGASLSSALERHPSVFSELFVSMVKVGEAGGVMDQVLDRLAELGTQEMEISSRVASAMTYPVVLVLLSFLIVNFILVGVLPKFVMVFKASDASLPLPTQIVLLASTVLRRFWWLILAGLGALFFYLQGVVRTPAGRRRFHALLLRVPLFGDLYRKVQISRFCRTLSTLTASGVPMLQALSVVENTVTNEVIRRAIADIRAAITAGSSLVEPFRQSGIFSPMVIQMVSIGEKSGQIDKMLDEVAQFYDPEIEYTIKNMTALLEPFMLLAMGLMVAFIALSVLLPIFNLIKVFRG